MGPYAGHILDFLLDIENAEDERTIEAALADYEKRIAETEGEAEAKERLDSIRRVWKPNGKDESGDLQRLLAIRGAELAGASEIADHEMRMIDHYAPSARTIADAAFIGREYTLDKFELQRELESMPIPQEIARALYEIRDLIEGLYPPEQELARRFLLKVADELYDPTRK